MVQLWLWKRTKTTLCPLGWGEEDLKKGLKTCPPDNLHTAARWLKMAIGWGLLLDSQNCLLWDAGFLFSWESQCRWKWEAPQFPQLFCL